MEVLRSFYINDLKESSPEQIQFRQITLAVLLGQMETHPKKGGGVS